MDEPLESDLSPEEVLGIAKGALYRLIPELPKARQTEGRMILKAMAIAQRALGGAISMGESEREALAQGLRARSIEDSADLRVRLESDVQQRLAITNPRALKP